MIECTKKYSTVVMVIMSLRIRKLNKQNMLAQFCNPSISHCFQRLVKTYFLLLDLLKACQIVLVEKIRFLTFSFRNTTLHDVLIKNRYQHNTS